jgi:hypothetical protein
MFWIKIITLTAMLASKMPDVSIPTTPSMTSTAKPQAVREFKVITGDVYKGEISSPNESGLVIKLDMGGFSERIPWGRFTQDTLKKLVTRPDCVQYARPFIEIPPEVFAKAKAKRAKRNLAFNAKSAPKVELPGKNVEFMASVTTPFSLVLLALIFGGNLYAAYEISIFRNRPIPLVCGVSFLFPIIGPIIFLSLPSVEEEVSTEVVSHGPEADYSELSAKAAAHTGGLSMSKGDKAPTATLQPATYHRNECEFDRRFFEVKFSGFFRVALGDAERDMMLVFKTPRNEYNARRIARITAKELFIQLFNGSEVSIAFNEIVQVQLKNKSDK